MSELPKDRAEVDELAFDGKSSAEVKGAAPFSLHGQESWIECWRMRPSMKPHASRHRIENVVPRTWLGLVVRKTAAARACWGDEWPTGASIDHSVGVKSEVV